MPDRIIYLDACVFLSYINDDEDRAQTVQAVLHEGTTGTAELYTSELSVVEVAFGATEQASKALDEETEQNIGKLWVPGSPINMIEYYGLIGEDAKELMRYSITKGWSLKPLDAIHLATARRVEVQEFHTYDPALEKYEETVGYKICEPHTVQAMLF